MVVYGSPEYYAQYKQAQNNPYANPAPAVKAQPPASSKIIAQNPPVKASPPASSKIITQTAPKPAPAPKAAPKAASGSYSGGGSSGGSSYSGAGSSGGSSYSGGSGGGGADFSAAPVAPPAPVMEDLTIPDPLADPTYQRQKAELLRARADFDAQQGLAKSQYDGTVAENMRQMGWREAVPVAGLRARVMGLSDGQSAGAGFDPNARGTAYGDSYEGNTGDFAGRGLFNSGLYGQAQGDLLNNFNDRRSGVLRDQKDWQDTQGLNQRNFEGQQNSTDLAAQSDAIAAIAARLGVDIGQVTPGRANVIQRQAV